VPALAVLAALTLSATAHQGDAVSIEWKFEKDKTFWQELTTKTTQNLKVQGMDITQDQEQTFYFSWTPMKQDEKTKNWEVKQTITGVKMKFNMAGQPIVYDSTSPAGSTSALTDFFKALINSDFTLTIGPDMKVVDVKGRDDFLKKLTTANQQMEGLLKKILSDEALKQMADPTFGISPGKPVKPGEKWEKKSSLNLGPIGNYDNTYTYTLTKVEKDVATIDVTTALTYKVPGEGSSEGLPFKIKSADLKPKDAKGTIQFNVKEGRLVSSTMSLNLEGKITIEIGGTSTEVELKQTQTTDVKTFNEDPLKKKQ